MFLLQLSSSFNAMAALEHGSFFQQLSRGKPRNIKLRGLDKVGVALKYQVGGDSAGSRGVHYPVAAETIDEIQTAYVW